MNFHIHKAALTDAGVGKRVNQDAILLRAAKSRRFGSVCFALVCDGLGGLSLGEFASAALSGRMERWFSTDFVALLRRAEKERADALRCLHRARIMWQSIFMEMNETIADYGRGQGLRLGTTAVAFLLIGQHYLVMHVGDSRLYIAKNGQLALLTHDHSLVQKQIDAGLLTPAQAVLSGQKSVLLQCIGASHVVRPDFTIGTLWQDTSVLLCSDGFWRRLREEELLEEIRPHKAENETDMRRTIRALTDNVKCRGERDNISVIFLHLHAETSIPPIPVPRAGEALPC